MKSLSKAVIRYKQAQQDAEYQRRYEEKLAKMTPEEREAYLQKRHEITINALAPIAMVNTYLGDKKYY